MERGTLKELTDGQTPKAQAPERNKNMFTDPSHLRSPGRHSAHEVEWKGGPGPLLELPPLTLELWGGGLLPS